MTFPIDAPYISMCWDGETKTAELRIDDEFLEGPPDVVRHMFDALNKLKSRALALEIDRENARRHLTEAHRLLGGWT